MKILMWADQRLNPCFDSDCKTLCCLCYTTAPIELSITVDRGGYACGETINVREHHGCRKLALFKSTSLKMWCIIWHWGVLITL